MLEFVSVGTKPTSFFKRFYQGEGVCICDKTVTCKKMWEGFGTSYAIACGCLILKNDSEFWGTAFDFPLKGEDGDVCGALEKIEDYCAEKGIKLRYCCLNTEQTAVLAARYSSFSCVNDRNYRDYIYSAAEMGSFRGKKYAGQRNHINKFLAAYPTAVFRSATNDDREKIFGFLKEWKETVLPDKSEGAANEYEKAVKFLEKADLNDFETGCVETDGKIIAFCLGEKVFGSTVIHIEKALHRYEGVNVFMVREFAAKCGTEFINREDDAATEGLRISKMQYHPLRLEPEFVMTVNNEAAKLSRIPTLKSERLTLGAIRKKETEEYYRLCTDDELNKYWGYDYRADLTGELTKDYFYNVAKTDFSNRTAVNFAIRKDGTFIGETVVYEFDFRGDCKVGVRILPEYAGHGYGKEAFERTVEFALYGLGVRKTLSSCYKENAPSVAMHNALMKKTGADEERFYYEREY